jgi:hypothetical protein
MSHGPRTGGHWSEAARSLEFGLRPLPGSEAHRRGKDGEAGAALTRAREVV